MATSSWRTITGVPDGWLVEVGVPGTDVRRTSPATQTLTIAGTPTSGSYHLKITAPFTGRTFATPTLLYNASAADVQTALQTIPGLENVTVESTGTSPDFTHTITYTGVAVASPSISVVYNFDTGTATAGSTTAGDAGANTGASLIFGAHASNTQTIYQEIEIEPETLYAFGMWMDATDDGYSLRVSLVDGIGGSYVNGPDGTAQNQTFIKIGAQSRAHLNAFFSVHRDTPMPIYLKIEKYVATNTTDLTFDDVTLTQAQQMYEGGPYYAIFAGRTESAVGDSFDIVTTNDYAGKWQQYFDAVFDMAGFDLRLPSGTATIPDSLIS